MMRRLAALAATGALAWAGQASAAELMLGAYVHDIGQYIEDRHSGFERGADIQFGVRSDRIGPLRFIGAPQAHAFLSANTEGLSNFAAVGLSWPIRLNHRFYFRPGFGFAYTDGKTELPASNEPGLPPEEILRRLQLRHDRIGFGSRWLFEPELDFGAHITGRWSAELSWVHLSNGEILHQGRNQGLDDVGVRVIYALGARGR
jgi:lipid A 3-O-deacylase